MVEHVPLTAEELAWGRHVTEKDLYDADYAALVRPFLPRLLDEVVRLQAERDRLLAFAACRAGEITTRQFVEYCGRDWQHDDAWPWYERTVVELAKRGLALVEGTKHD